MPALAERMSRATPSAIMMIAEKAKRLKAQGRDIISFSVGVPNFLPPKYVYDAARAALEADAGQYLPGRGIDELLDAYLLRLRENGFSGYERANVASGIGGKHVLFSLLYALLNEGDELLIPTPYWSSYSDIANLLGVKPVYLECPAERDYKLTAEQLEARIGTNARVLLFNNPSNPTGMVYTEGELHALGEVLERHDLWVISDDIYNRMIFDGLGFAHLIKTNPALRDRVIMVDSVSKSYGMPGWRVGLIAGPESVADAMVTLNSNLITNISGVVSSAAAAALAGPQDVSDQMCKEFQKKRDQVMETMNRIEGIRCPRPQGAFYAFPDVSAFYGRELGEQTVGNDTRFAELLLDTEGLAVVPGRAFGEPRAIRISYACKPEDLTEGLRRFEAFVSALR